MIRIGIYFHYTVADNQLPENQQAREVNDNHDQNVNPDPVQAQDRQGKISIDRRYLNSISDFLYVIINSCRTNSTRG